MAKTKKQKEKVSSSELANTLEDIRRNLADLRTQERLVTKSLLETLHQEGSTHAGNYHIVKADTFKVGDEELALSFALERGLTKIDVSKVKKVFQLDTNLRFQDPEQYGFSVVTQEKIAPVHGSLDEDI